jgi:hypothetical protein
VQSPTSPSVLEDELELQAQVMAEKASHVDLFRGFQEDKQHVGRKVGTFI